jgi:hypothetical protein
VSEVAEPEAEKGGATSSPLASARAHRWVDVPPSSGFSVAPYDALGRRQFDGRISTSTRTVVMRRSRARLFYPDPDVNDDDQSDTMVALALFAHDDDDPWPAMAHRHGDGPSARR